MAIFTRRCSNRRYIFQGPSFWVSDVVTVEETHFQQKVTKGSSQKSQALAYNGVKSTEQRVHKTPNNHDIHSKKKS